VEHMRAIAEQKREAAWKQEKRERLKALERVSDITARMKRKAQLCARLRDAALGCISCGTLIADEYHGGHFFPAHKHPLVRFDWRRNIHKQCKRCNKDLHGNLTDYRENLILKIGPEAFAELQELSKTTSYKHTREELAVIENQLNADLKELKA